jgi:hypothetical protein
MTPQDAFYQTVHAYPGGCESLGPRMGMSAAVLRAKANPHGERNHPTLADADKAIGLTGDFRLLHALAANHSHVCVPVDADVQPSDLAVLELVTAVWRSHGDVGATVDAALADGRIEQREVGQIRDAIYTHIQALQHMLKRIEQLQEPARPAPRRQS